jgi:hypothetical protein
MVTKRLPEWDEPGRSGIMLVLVFRRFFIIKGFLQRRETH